MLVLMPVLVLMLWEDDAECWKGWSGMASGALLDTKYDCNSVLEGAEDEAQGQGERRWILDCVSHLANHINDKKM